MQPQRTNLHELKRLMDSYDYKVVVVFDVENKTPYPLNDPVVHVTDGAIETPFQTIEPNSSAMFVARKGDLLPRGSGGTVSWKIKRDPGPAHRVVLMWSVPYNRAAFDNCLAVGISEPSDKPVDHDWFKSMYSVVSRNQDLVQQGKEISFHGGIYNTVARIARISKDGICVEGTMGTRHKTQVCVTIREEKKERR